MLEPVLNCGHLISDTMDITPRHFGREGQSWLKKISYLKVESLISKCDFYSNV